MTATDASPLAQQKKALRKRMLAVRDRDHNIFIDKNIAHRLTHTRAWQQAKTIFIYVSFGSEIDTHAIIKNALASGKTVTVPLCEAHHAMTARIIRHFPADLASGAMGILEPDAKSTPICPAEAIDLAIVPGVAFAKDGRRLGYGGGYYDRYLRTIHQDIPKIAMIPGAQITDDIPTDTHDLPVDALMTERGIIDCTAIRQHH